MASSISQPLKYLFISYHNIFEFLEKEEIRGKRRIKRIYAKVLVSYRLN